mgnify:CR=1 FL=1
MLEAFIRWLRSLLDDIHDYLMYDQPTYGGRRMGRFGNLWLPNPVEPFRRLRNYIVDVTHNPYGYIPTTGRPRVPMTLRERIRFNTGR